MPALPSSVSSSTESPDPAAAGDLEGTAAVPAPRARRRSRTSGPSIPLGSLTQREHRATTECLGCGSTRVTRLSLNLTDGTPVEFTSCHKCEHRSWEHAGDPLSMDVVLDRTRKV
jgi:hypothetical protein